MSDAPLRRFGAPPAGARKVLRPAASRPVADSAARSDAAQCAAPPLSWPARTRPEGDEYISDVATVVQRSNPPVFMDQANWTPLARVFEHFNRAGLRAPARRLLLRGQRLGCREDIAFAQPLKPGEAHQHVVRLRKRLEHVSSQATAGQLELPAPLAARWRTQLRAAGRTARPLGCESTGCAR